MATVERVQLFSGVNTERLSVQVNDFLEANVHKVAGKILEVEHNMSSAFNGASCVTVHGVRISYEVPVSEGGGYL